MIVNNYFVHWLTDKVHEIILRKWIQNFEQMSHNCRQEQRKLENNKSLTLHTR